MKVLLIGNGGRETALAWRLAQSPEVAELLVTTAHPGWPDGVRIIEGAPEDTGADLVVVGPEGPLVDGLADRCAARGVPCFGPVAAAARLEGSKSWAKEVLNATGVPTAASVSLDLTDPALDATVATWAERGVVLKADGLAAGKGVFVCDGPEDAATALLQLRKDFRDAAGTVVIEERLHGPETSLFALSDGKRAVGLASTRDHKQLLDGGRGPNTGGMGAICPDPRLSDDDVDALVAQIHQPVIDELARRGIPFRGVLYAGLMLTDDGPKVLEFNVRFGDPECQVLMARWRDPLPWLLGAARGELPTGRPDFSPQAACCVVLAAAGYPGTPERGQPLPTPPAGSMSFLAGVRDDDGQLLTNGGRVLGATAVGDSADDARRAAYELADALSFPGAQRRGDIGLSDGSDARR